MFKSRLSFLALAGWFVRGDFGIPHPNPLPKGEGIVAPIPCYGLPLPMRQHLQRRGARSPFSRARSPPRLNDLSPLFYLPPKVPSASADTTAITYTHSHIK